MICLYLLGQNCLHLTFQPYWSSETYSRNFEKMPNIVIHACKILQKKMNLLKMCGPHFRFCLFTCWHIASKQLNSFTTIDTLSWLGGTLVTHPLWVHEVPVWIPAPEKVFMFDFLFCCSFAFTFCQKTLFVTHFCNSFCYVNLFNILHVSILQDFWPIIMLV